MWFFIPVFILIAVAVFFVSPVGKGLTGEWVIRLFIGGSKPKKGKFVISDLTFVDGTHEVHVDHIVVNKQGIHVIETENMAGIIYGKESDTEWEQTLEHGKIKKKFYSPIKQNSGHIYSLKKVLNTDVPFFSYIVFTGRGSLAVKTVHVPVEYPLAFSQALKSKKAQEVLDLKQAEDLYHSILELKKKS
ncbi:MAG: NERD domain-containing protein [Acholeplasmataceae bacterium]|nr:NERD domain-containing protein [Acholeplasmataceae bacterium]